jgi:membrane protein YqaA with SNARE-associated domain
MAWLKRLYHWVLSWADHPYGTAALAVLAFTESSVFPIPPDVLLIALCLGNRRRWLYFALVCTVASVTGAWLGYWIGAAVWAQVNHVFYAWVPGFTPEIFESMRFRYDAYNFWIVFLAGFTPIPFKVITISAGVFGIAFVPFTIAALIGRGARFLLVAFLLYYFGAPIKNFIDRRFNLLTIIFTVLLIGGFLILRLL